MPRDDAHPTQWILDESKREVFLLTACRDDSGSQPASPASAASSPGSSSSKSPQQLAGMCMTWVTPAGLEQNRVVLVLSPHNATTHIVLNSGHFVLHLLSIEQMHLIKTFGLQSSRDVNKFEGLDYTTLDNGVPVLPDTCGWAKGTVMNQMDTGDRYIVVAHVENHDFFPDKTPLRVQDLRSTLDAETQKALDQKFRRDIKRDRKMRVQQEVSWMAKAEKCEDSARLVANVKPSKVGIRKGKKNEAKTVYGSHTDGSSS